MPKKHPAPTDRGTPKLRESSRAYTKNHLTTRGKSPKRTDSMAPQAQRGELTTAPRPDQGYRHGF